MLKSMTLTVHITYTVTLVLQGPSNDRRTPQNALETLVIIVNTTIFALDA